MTRLAPARRVAGCCALLTAASIAIAHAEPTARGTGADLVLISRADGPHGARANASSYLPQLSAGGSSVLFVSRASNIVQRDRRHDPDVFVRDLRSGRTRLVSHQAIAGAIIAPSGAITADGRFVVYQGTIGRHPNVYVRDLRTGAVELVSRATGVRGPRANNGSSWGTISADGRLVVFQSRATNLTGRRQAGVFMRDRRTDRTTQLIAWGAGELLYATPVITAAGGHVVFARTPLGGGMQVYILDRRTGRIDLVSRASGMLGAPGNDLSYGPSVSGDGKTVAFLSAASNLGGSDDVQTDVFVRNVPAGTTTQINAPSPAAAPVGRDIGDGALAVDGRRLTFLDYSRSVDGAPVADLMLRDLVRGSDSAVLSQGTAGRIPFTAFPDSGSDSVALTAFAETNRRPERTDVYVRSPPSP